MAQSARTAAAFGVIKGKRMRFEAKAALTTGILLPVLETYRRGLSHWSVEFTTMFEDYLAGALLLAGAWAAFRRHPLQAPLLLVAWGWVTGMMTISFVSQVEMTVGGVDLEPQNADVLVVKFLLLALSTAALLRSFRFVGASMTPNQPFPPTSGAQVKVE